MKTLLLLALSVGLCFAQNARTLDRKPLCSASVTTNCVTYRDASGNVSIGTRVLDPATSEPTCNAANRGHEVRVHGGAGVADTVRRCDKTAADTYAWVAAAGGGDNLGTATATDVAALFSGAGDYLKADGSTGTPSSFDPTAPGAIGGTTPAAGTFTALTATSLSVTSDGVHAGIDAMAGNTTAPAIPSNSSGWLGPNSASFTSYFLQLPATAPAANSVLNVGAPSGGIAQVTFGPPPATSLPTPGTSITLSAPRGYAFCTGACNVTLPTPAAGYEFCVRNSNNVGTAITLVNLTGVSFEATARTSYYAANRKLVSGGAVTDQICVVGYDATHYAVMSSTGTWTDTAP